MRLEWSDKSKELSSIEELESTLNDLHLQNTEKPILAELISPTGEALTIGLGNEMSLLTYMSADQNPPYYTSKGVPTDGSTVFFYHDQWTEFSNKNLNSFDKAVEAAKKFFQVSKLPDNVEWTEA
jgi:hypothetical protein